MTRDAVVALVTRHGFQPWGKLRRRDGSSYQCYRRGRTYVWVGLRYIESNHSSWALDFVTGSPATILRMVHR